MTRALIILSILALAPVTTNAAALEKIVCVERCDKPPVIDGVLDDKCWDRNEFFSDFVHIRTHDNPKNKTEVGIVYDKTYLYMAIVCHGRILEKYRKEYTPPAPGKYSPKYTFEIGIDPQNHGLNHYQFVFGPKGEKSDFQNTIRLTSRGPTKVGWEGKWDFKYKVYPNRRTTEIRIRWDCMMKDAPPATGRVMGLELARNDWLIDSMWTETDALFHDGRHWGVMVTGGYNKWWNSYVLEQSRKIRAFLADRKITDAQLAKNLYRLLKLPPPASRSEFRKAFIIWNGIQNKFIALKDAAQVKERDKAPSKNGAQK